MVSNLRKTICFLLFFAALYNIHAFDIEVTGISVETYIRIENNRNFGTFAEFSAIGELEVNENYLLRGGLALGELAGGTDLKSFVLTTASPFTKVPIDFSLLWIYNGLFEYDIHSNSIMPVVTYNFFGRAGLSIGYNFRFTSFFGESAIREGTPAYSFYFNFIDNEHFLLGFIWGNFNEFTVRPLAAYTYNFNAAVRINKNWQISTEIEFLQTGGFALTELLYGVSSKTGVRYTW